MFVLIFLSFFRFSMINTVEKMKKIMLERDTAGLKPAAAMGIRLLVRPKVTGDSI